MSELKDLNEKLQNNSAVKVEWHDKKTESNIEIAGGPTTVKRTGTVVGVLPMPQQNGMVMCVAVAGDDKRWYIVNMDGCKIL